MPAKSKAGRERETNSLMGAYKMCGRLLTSPVFNKTQREVIEEQAYATKDQLEALGVAFLEPDEGVA